MPDTALRSPDQSHALDVVLWVSVYVLIPLVVYPAQFVQLMLADKPVTWVDMIAKGEIFLLVVIMIAALIGELATLFILTEERFKSKQVVKFAIFVFAIISLLFYAMFYGILTTIPHEKIQQKEMVAWFAISSLISYSLGCGWLSYRIRVERTPS